MNLQRRLAADPQAITQRLLTATSRILVIAQAYKQVINLLGGDMEQARNNAFYREHVSGQGWRGVSNQTGSSIDFVLRQAADSWGLKATEGNWGAIFVSARALSSLMIHGEPRKFSDLYHCEHTVQNRQRREELIDWIVADNVNSSVEIARWILANTVVATVLNEERNDSGTHENLNHRPFWRYAQMNTSVLCWRNHRGFVPANMMTMAEIAMIQTREDPLISRILDCLDGLDDNYHSKLVELAEQYLYHKTESYHQIPQDLAMFVHCDLDELEQRHYTHRRTKAKYTGSKNEKLSME